ncbi:MAG: hypothetical protein L7F77_02730 [Candidatus Magnetominusculus sp. LBB02]|nr:hypothetical protein [Candidatus Magnetominusculus sp. LBB02]
MSYKEAFYNGFYSANKNIMLPLIKMAAQYILLIGLVIVSIISVLGAVLMFGTGMLAALKGFNMENAGALLSSKYLILVVVLAVVLLFYVLIASLAVLFVYGGECGMIARGIKEADFKFELGDFFIEGKRYFGPVFWFTSIVWSAALIVLLLLAASAIPLVSIINSLEGTSAGLSTFIAVLSVLAGSVVLFFLFTGTLAVTMYGTAMMIFNGVTARQASNDAVKVLFRRPSAFGFYLLCVVVYFAVAMIIAGSTVAIVAIPVIGTIIVIPYHLLVQVVQSYLAVLFIAVLFSYYYGVEGQGRTAATFGMTTHAIDISAEAGGQGQSPSHPAAPDEGAH